MKRRAFVLTALAVPMLAFARPESLDKRKAKFEEVGASVLMTLAMPELIQTRDVDAVKSIDSGFDTTLRYSLRVWEWGSRELVHSRVVVVTIRRDPWKKRYVVSTKNPDGWRRRFFEKRDAAIASATTLRRHVVAAVSDLERSDDGPYYFVEILALRNPLEGGDSGRGRSVGRGSGRDLEWFSRLVDGLVKERVQAEAVVHLRTNPFYLVPEP